MKTVKKPTSPKTHIILLVIIAILSVALITVALIAFLPGPEDDSSGDSSDGTTIPTFAIETPYCVLKYPEQWKDQMTVKESNADGILTETFCANISGTQYELFTVYFGNSTVGELFGYLPTEGGNIAVYIECHKLPEDHALAENDVSLFYSMIEGVNEVAQSIAATKGYVEA